MRNVIRTFKQRVQRRGLWFTQTNQKRARLCEHTVGFHSSHVQIRSTGLEIISRLAPVKLSGQTYFCSDTTHFWPDKSPLRHISTKFPPSPCSMMFTYQTSTFSKPLLYMEPRTHCRKSGMHGTATTFGKINITFVHASIASVLCLLYR